MEGGKKYRERISDAELQRKLQSSGAVLIEGAKWCGKTTSAMQAAKSALYFNDPDMKGQIEMMLDVAPRRLLEGKTPLLLDEWQEHPVMWDAVRFEVDKRGEPGQFILTGSAVPADMTQVHHSGTGRIARIRMRPMSLYESGESSGEVSLERLFNGEHDISGRREMTVDELAFLIARGGWPAALGIPEGAALDQARNYFDGVVNSDILRVDGVQRKPHRTRTLMRAYARAVGTQAKLTTLATDASGGDARSMASSTVSEYLEALRQIFVIEEADNWAPRIRSRVALRTSATRYFTDPSIAVAALEAGPGELVNDLPTMGLLFENLVVRDLRVYASKLRGEVMHFLNKNGLEVDAIVRLPNGKYGLVEVKLSYGAVEQAAEVLKKFASMVDTRYAPAPSFLMVIIGVGSHAARRKDGVLVVPISTLTA